MHSAHVWTFPPSNEELYLSCRPRSVASKFRSALHRVAGGRSYSNCQGHFCLALNGPCGQQNASHSESVLSWEKHRIGIRFNHGKTVLVCERATCHIRSSVSQRIVAQTRDLKPQTLQTSQRTDLTALSNPEMLYLAPAILSCRPSSVASKFRSVLHRVAEGWSAANCQGHFCIALNGSCSQQTASHSESLLTWEKHIRSSHSKTVLVCERATCRIHSAVSQRIVAQTRDLKPQTLQTSQRTDLTACSNFEMHPKCLDDGYGHKFGHSSSRELFEL